MQVPNYVLYAGILTPVCVYLGTLLHILHQVSLLSNISAFTEASSLLSSMPRCSSSPLQEAGLVTRWPGPARSRWREGSSSSCRDQSRSWHTSDTTYRVDQKKV